MKKPERANIVIRVTPEFRDKIREEAEKEGRSVSNYVKRLLDRRNCKPT